MQEEDPIEAIVSQSLRGAVERDDFGVTVPHRQLFGTLHLTWTEVGGCERMALRR
jgi:hypothetical protein